MKDSFQEGFEYFRKNATSVVGAADGADFVLKQDAYTAAVKMEISELEKNINSFNGIKTPVNKLKGDIAEFWHAGTFNVNAVTNHSINKMSVHRSYEFGSVDVSGSYGQNYGMKYYSSGTESVKAQAISWGEKFKGYQLKGGKEELEKYISDRNYKSTDKNMNASIYEGQIRIIPRDQIEEATKYLKVQIEKERVRRPERARRYQETLEMLTDKISDNKGNESIPLSKEEAEKITILAKKGEFDASKLGIKAPTILNFELVIKEALKAGVSASLISLVLKVGPEIYKTIDHLIKNGEIEEEEFKKLGFAAASGSSEGFIRGSVAAAITTCSKSGMLGTAIKRVNPSVIGAFTVITMNALKNSYGVAVGKKTRTEVSNELMKDMFVSACSLIGGSITQVAIEVPVLGYLIGSFVGSILGSFTYNAGYKTTISLCVDSGFTMFGIVEQDYVLPDRIIEEIGIETFKYESFMPDTFKPDTFEFKSFETDWIEPDGIGIKYLRRGVIGVTKIGYIQ